MEIVKNEGYVCDKRDACPCKVVCPHKNVHVFNKEGCRVGCTFPFSYHSEGCIKESMYRRKYRKKYGKNPDICYTSNRK